MYDAIFFDLDGTLIDTERLAIETGRAAFLEHGHQETEALLHSLIGVDQPAAESLILEAFPDIDPAGLQGRWRAGFDMALAEGIPLKLHAERVVHGLATRHCLALVTSSSQAAAHDKLSRSGLLPAFRTIVTRDDVNHPKPSPEPYLLAARRVGASPSACLVFEDSETGAMSAHAAGMTVVRIPDIREPSGRHAHHVAPDLLAALVLTGLNL